MWVPELLSERIPNSRLIRVNLATPCIQQIGFGAKVHFFSGGGPTDLVTMALVAIMIIRKKRVLSPNPKLSRTG